MKRIAVVFYLGVLCASKFPPTASAEPNKPLYENNFEKAVIGSVPDDFLVLDGGFAVQEEAGNKFLELPGAPLETFGVIFGTTEKENVAVSARIYGTSKGRRSPTFAVGVGGQGGYRLQVAPSKKLIELYKGDMVKTSVAFEWQSGKWTQFKLQVRKMKNGDWRVEGKVWPQGSKEPEGWMITSDEKQEPPNGRASVWGSPYAGTPIRFDDFVVARTAAK